MPYDTLDDLPSEQTVQYTTKRKQAFRKAFNHAVENENTAFARAHHAAQNAGD